MNPALLTALLQEIVIPELAAIFRAHHAATGTMPTDAQVFAALGSDADKGISIGQAWLAAHPASPTSPSTNTGFVSP